MVFAGLFNKERIPHESVKTWLGEMSRCVFFFGYQKGYEPLAGIVFRDFAAKFRCAGI